MSRRRGPDPSGPRFCHARPGRSRPKKGQHAVTMTDLWTEASEDHDAISRQAALATAEGHLDALWPFFFQAASARELDHRLAIGETRLWHIASNSGIEVQDLEDLIRRRYALMRQALAEGQDPVGEVVQSTHPQGAGPEKPDEHDEGVDYSHGYSEVPQGAPGGPNPSVVRPVFPQGGAPSEATAAKRCSCGRKMKNGKCKKCTKTSFKCDCTPAGAADGDDVSPPGKPGMKEGRRITATSPGPTQAPANLPAGAGSASSSPDGMQAGGLDTSTRQRGLAGPSGTTQTSQGAAATYDLTPAQDVRTAARRDPVAHQIRMIASSVRAANPHLADSECRRIARRVVGGYLHTADLASSVYSDEPWGGSGGGDQGYGGMSGLEEYGLGKGLLSKIPGGGGGAGEAGGAAELGEVAELAAL